MKFERRILDCKKEEEQKNKTVCNLKEGTKDYSIIWSLVIKVK